MGVHVPPILNPSPPPSPSHLSGLSQCPGFECPGFECPVSCIELGLVIYFTYGNKHVSILFSQVISPSPSPTDSKEIFLLLLLSGHCDQWSFFKVTQLISGRTRIEFGLAIYFTYGNMHVSMLFYQIIPPSPSPTESKTVLYIHVSFAVSHIGSLLPSF